MPFALASVLVGYGLAVILGGVTLMLGYQRVARYAVNVSSKSRATTGLVLILCGIGVLLGTVQTALRLNSGFAAVAELLLLAVVPVLAAWARRTA